MLIRWYMYSQYRKRKKCRINQAIERRRNRLVKNGIIQWLSVANDLSGLRAKFAAQQHATVSHHYILKFQCQYQPLSSVFNVKSSHCGTKGINIATKNETSNEICF